MAHGQALMAITARSAGSWCCSLLPQAAWRLQASLYPWCPAWHPANALGPWAPAWRWTSANAPGGVKMVEWRGKPVWIMRRTTEMLAVLPQQDAALADPASHKDQQPEYARNPQRSIPPEGFVTVGICIYLGCSPTAVPAGTANPALATTGNGGFSALAMVPPLTWRAGCTRTSPRAPIWRCRRTAIYVSDTHLRIGDDAA